MAEENFTNTSDDPLVMQQYVDTFRRSEHLDPEKSLLAAILEDAIQEYRKYSKAVDADGKRRFGEVDEWIGHAGTDWIFSFDNICELLGLDPHSVRRRLRKIQHDGEETKRWVA